MIVEKYFLEHFDELSPEKQFHFASHHKNWFNSDYFNEYFKENILDTDLRPILENNDFSNVNNLTLRQPFFEKYDHIFAIEAALFRVNYLLHEFNIDVRSDFRNLLKQKGLLDLHALSNRLIDDIEALITLSTWAGNLICLTENLYPRNIDVYSLLAEKTMDAKGLPILLIYFYTHLMICDTGFLVREIPKEHHEIYRALLDRAGKWIEEDPDSFTLDVRLEFLVCAKMINAEYPQIASVLKKECDACLIENSFLVDPRNPRKNTLDTAEHRNMLYIMSGLDRGDFSL